MCLVQNSEISAFSTNCSEVVEKRSPYKGRLIRQWSYMLFIFQNFFVYQNIDACSVIYSYIIRHLISVLTNTYGNGLTYLNEAWAMTPLKRLRNRITRFKAIRN